MPSRRIGVSGITHAKLATRQSAVGIDCDPLSCGHESRCGVHGRPAKRGLSATGGQDSSSSALAESGGQRSAEPGGRNSSQACARAGAGTGRWSPEGSVSHTPRLDETREPPGVKRGLLDPREDAAANRAEDLVSSCRGTPGRRDVRPAKRGEQNARLLAATRLRAGCVRGDERDEREWGCRLLLGSAAGLWGCPIRPEGKRVLTDPSSTQPSWDGSSASFRRPVDSIRSSWPRRRRRRSAR